MLPRPAGQLRRKSTELPSTYSMAAAQVLLDPTDRRDASQQRPSFVPPAAQGQRLRQVHPGGEIVRILPGDLPQVRLAVSEVAHAPIEERQLVPSAVGPQTHVHAPV